MLAPPRGPRRRPGDLAFIQREDDPFAFIDGDDIRDPETGDVHPEFLRLLDALGLSYADVSTSGGGVHVMYRGELPGGVKQAVFETGDEPFGSHDEGDRPTVEIYDGKRVCIATGDHVPGSGLQVREWAADALEDVLDEYGELPDRERPADGYDEFDADEYEPSATGADEATDDIRAVAVAHDPVDGYADDLAPVYPEAYGRARDDYGAPLPRYLTTATPSPSSTPSCPG